jgi:hypothetical protein
MGYALVLAWVSGWGISPRTVRTLALLDGSWVVGTAAMLALVGKEFSLPA